MSGDAMHRFLSAAFVPYWGAGNPYQDALAEHLSARGVQVQKLRSLKDMFRCAVLVNRSVDVVHLHWLPVFRWSGLSALRCLSFIISLALLRIYGVRLVWTAHNLLPHEFRHPKLDWLLRRIVVGFSHGIIVHCETAKHQVMKVWRLKDPGRIAVIPHGNYLENYPDDVSRAAARERLALDDTEVVFLFLGAVRPYKGVLELIDAFRGLAADRATLVIAGKPLNHDFAQQIEIARANSDHIRFHPGFVPEDEVQVYMNAADVAVLPYRQVLSSGAALLAMSFGKPCVAPAIGCLADVLDDSGAFLYDPESETGLVESMRRAVEAKEGLARMGELNRKTVSQWTWAKAAEATQALYQCCLPRATQARCDAGLVHEGKR